MSRLDRLFAPQWAGPWALARVLFGCASLYGLFRRFQHLQDVGRSGGVVWEIANFGIDNPPLTLPMAYVAWAIAFIGLAALLWGGRWAKPGLGLYVVGYYAMILGIGLSFRAPERMTAWMSLALLVAPIGERDLVHKYRSPLGRWILLCCFIGLYGETGLLKLMNPAWRTGETLSLAALEIYMGGRPLAVWLSQWAPLMFFLSWWTMLFEVLFPVLVFVRKINPYLLLVGALFHVGTSTLLWIGPLTWIVLSAYPVLLHPEVARDLWVRLDRPRARN